MKTQELSKLVARAVHEALQEMGFEAFKETSFFMSNYRVGNAHKRAA